MKVVVFFILFFVSAMKNLLAGRLVVILKLSIRTGRDELVLDIYCTLEQVVF